MRTLSALHGLEAHGVNAGEAAAWLECWGRTHWPTCQQLWPRFAHRFALDQTSAPLRAALEEPLRRYVLDIFESARTEMLWDIVIRWFVEDSSDPPAVRVAALRAKAERECALIPQWRPVIAFLDAARGQVMSPTQVLHQLDLARAHDLHAAELTQAAAVLLRAHGF